MDYQSLKSAKMLGALSSLVAVCQTFNLDDAMKVSGYKQRYLIGDITLSSLKMGVFPFVVGAVRDLTYAMNEFRSSPDVWKSTILDYKYHLDQICKLL